MKRYMAAACASLMLAATTHAAAPPTPAEFVSKASEAGLAEVELGKLAVKNAASPQVRAYGQRMITDHEKAGAELDALAAKKNLATTKALNAMHQKAVQSLGEKKGMDFDAAYAAQMMRDHDEAVALFTSGTTLADRDLASFASRTLPTLREHQQMASQLDKGH
jgi:putative membrane protein